MNRRTLLQQTAALGTLGLAGCLSDANDDSATQTDDQPAPTATPTATETPRPSTAVASSSIETVSTGCDSGDGSTATVDFGSDGVVYFSGRVTTANPCYDATLQSVDYAEELDRLAIHVGTASRDEICVDCVGVVEFEGRVEFTGRLPDEAYVSHGDTILGESGETATSDESRASGDRSRRLSK